LKEEEREEDARELLMISTLFEVILRSIEPFPS
jgi:hypothetical protein